MLMFNLHYFCISEVKQKVLYDYRLKCDSIKVTLLKKNKCSLLMNLPSFFSQKAAKWFFRFESSCYLFATWLTTWKVEAFGLIPLPKRTCRLDLYTNYPFNAERQVGKLWITLTFKVLIWLDEGIEPKVYRFWARSSITPMSRWKIDASMHQGVHLFHFF